MIKAMLITSSTQSTLSFFMVKTQQKAGVSPPPTRERQVSRLRKLAMDILRG